MPCSRRSGRPRGPGQQAGRRRLLGILFARATPAEQSFLTRLLAGELHQGALEGVMTEAVARAAGVDAAEVRRALMLGGSLPAVAEAALSAASAARRDQAAADGAATGGQPVTDAPAAGQTMTGQSAAGQTAAGQTMTDPPAADPAAAQTVTGRTMTDPPAADESGDSAGLGRRPRRAPGLPPGGAGRCGRCSPPPRRRWRRPSTGCPRPRPSGRSTASGSRCTARARWCGCSPGPWTTLPPGCPRSPGPRSPPPPRPWSWTVRRSRWIRRAGPGRSRSPQAGPAPRPRRARRARMSG